jgi:preprotein translocase subunit SecA
VERHVLLNTIDALWVEHLTELDDMRRGIGLRGYAQQDPLNEFRREAYRMYEEFRDLIRHGVASSIFRVTVQRQPPPGADGGVAEALARGAEALRGSSGNGAGAGSGTAAQPVAARTAAAGSAILRGSLPKAPAVRNVTASLGGEPVTDGGGGDPGLSVAGGPKPGYTPTGARIGRNDPCWCGSGAKYKKCHGR